jgi:cytochrome P450
MFLALGLSQYESRPLLVAPMKALCCRFDAQIMNQGQTEYFESRLISAEFVKDPYPLLHELRSQEPVYWSEAIGAWLLTRYDDVALTMKDPAHFSNENRLGQAVTYLPPEKRANFKAFEDHYKTKGLLHSDPPDHTRLRALVTKEFTPKVVEQIKPQIQKVVDGVLDEAEQKGEMDVVPDLAEALPIGVIAEILGVPVSDRHIFKKWTDAILGFQGVNKPSEADLLRAQESLVDLRVYLREMIDERRRTPREDLMSKFVALESEGERLSEAELINTCVTLFTAGHETTLSLISNSIYTLLANPDQLQLLREKPELLIAALEESLRFESPVSRQSRLMKADAELGGKTLKKGEMLFQMLNAVNRDPAYFPDPDRFDIRRLNNRHMAFGQGMHFCVGAPLARAEGLIAVGTTIKRFPKLSLVDSKPDWDSGKRNSRVLLSLRVRLG